MYVELHMAKLQQTVLMILVTSPYLCMNGIQNGTNVSNFLVPRASLSPLDLPWSHPYGHRLMSYTDGFRKGYGIADPTADNAR